MIRPAAACARAAILALGLCAAALPAGAATVVYSNALAPGDAFTNTGASNQGQAVGASGWYYNNVRNSGSVGISVSEPRSGNGSAAFGSPTGAAKADIEYLPAAVNLLGNFASTGALGAFADLASMSYEWYRDSASTNPAVQHPVMRVLLDADGNLATVTDRGGLVFERAYNSLSTPTGAWTADTIGAATNLWNFGLGLGFAANINSTPYAYDATLAEWQAYLPAATIIGFSLGVGSGWNGAFAGAVDNPAWTIGSATTHSNFEVAPIPLPLSAAFLLTALGALGVLRRRRARA